jgi:serine/threonine-protein kinase
VVWQFGPYRMDALIARGGMGEVHRAYDTQHDRVVAVKLLAGHVADDEAFRQRFIREARAAARLREPHVIPIHAYGEIDGRLYLDMRLVEGPDLSTILANRGPLDPAAAVDVIRQVASALDAAHAEGLVHRDVKPSNVLVDGSGFAYLVDFGIARSMGPAADITGTGIPVGTVAYMAPERFATEPVDHRVDVYSLACLLYQCLTGAPPFPEGNALALMHAHLNQPPPRLTAHRPDLPDALDDVIATGMAKHPEVRYTTAGGLAAAATQALTRRLPTTPVPVTQAAPSRRFPWWPVAAIVVALAVAAALIWLPNWNTVPPKTDTPAPTGSTETPSASLPVSSPLNNPPCDGEYIVIVGSAVNPQEYPDDVQSYLDEHPGSKYLHAPTTGCTSLRHQLNGADIYSVYLGPFPDRTTACAKRTTVGNDSFVRRLDNTSSPNNAVTCG